MPACLPNSCFALLPLLCPESRSCPEPIPTPGGAENRAPGLSRGSPHETPRSPSNYRQPCRSGFPRARSALSRQVPPARAPSAGPRRIPGSAPLAWVLSPGSPRLGAGSGNSSSSSSGGSGSNGGRSRGRRSAGGRRGDAVRGSAIGLSVRWARRRAALLRGMGASHGLTASRGAGAGAGAGARAGAEPGRREAGAACRP